MTHCDMSGSEDGQLRSPGDEPYISGDDDAENDTDSLDIKPPQATLHRDTSGNSSRRVKPVKEKKHSKERRRKDRSSGSASGAVVEAGSDREQRSHQHKSSRGEIGAANKYHHRSSGEFRDRYEKDNIGGGSIMMPDDRRYNKYFDRHSRGGGGGSSDGSRHHHQQMNRRNDSYERGNNGGGAVGGDYDYDYHNTRHKHRSAAFNHRGEFSHDGGGGQSRSDRHRYMEPGSYDSRQDAETLEQDLRSRLLSKRHKYVKEYPASRYQQDAGGNHYDKRAHYESHRSSGGEYKERHSDSIIEVIDSPEQMAAAGGGGGAGEGYKSKPKKSVKEKSDGEREKRSSMDDPDLMARRMKLLGAEREMAKRKEAAREELEARRELRRGELIEVSSSPTRPEATTKNDEKAAPRTKWSHSADGEHRIKRKKIHKSTAAASAAEVSDDQSDEGVVDEDDVSGEEEEDVEEEHDDNDDDDEDGEADSSESEAHSNRSYEKTAAVAEHKVKAKAIEKKKRKYGEENDGEDEDEEVPLPDSPLSIGDLSKSPPKKHRRRHRHQHKLKKRKRHSAPQSRSQSRERSRSKSLVGEDINTSRSRSNSATLSRSRSVSRSSRSQSQFDESRSRSRTRSRSRSEERDMKARNENATAGGESDVEMKNETGSSTTATTTTGEVKKEDASPARDEKGAKLPNYFPGIQGCRSVEEFQCLNRIEEGTYGVVYRAKDKRTSEIVALKRLKMEKEKEGFPITSLREINTLLKGQHPNIVTVREIVVGSNMDKIFIVMDYVEHDLKSLMETMKHKEQSFFPGEVKCLTQQLLRAIGHLHDNWILHRDLKTSNLLLSHKGILKVGDFGLAREYGSPLKKYTSLVVTLWYRAPELLLCSPEYSTPIDIWSVGCIFAEFLQMLPLFPGKSEIDQLNRIFKELGTPNEKIWPGYKELPAVKNLLSQNSQFTEYPVSNLRKRFLKKSTETGIALLQGLLTYDPKQRLTADSALKHPYFKELPLPIDPSMFPTWPAKSELGARKALASSPKPPSGGSQFKQLGRDEVINSKPNPAVNAAAVAAASISGIISGNKKSTSNTGFILNSGLDQRQMSMGPGFSLKF